MRILLFCCVSGIVSAETLAPVRVVAQKIYPLTFTKDEISYVDIEHRYPETLQDVLENISGVQFTSYGGIGALSNVSLQGGNVNHTLITLDGMSAEDPATPEGAVNMAMFTADAFDHLSVKKGPLSSVYGAGGLAGVIALESEKGKGKPTHKLSIGGGSRGTSLMRLRSQGQIHRFSYNIAATHLATQGIRIKPGNLALVPRDHLTDKARLLNMRGRFDGDISDDLSVTWISRYEDARSAYNGYYTSANPSKLGYTRGQQQVFKVTKMVMCRGWSGEQSLAYGFRHQTRIDREQYQPFLKKDLNEGYGEQLHYALGIERNGISILGGGEYRRDKMSVYQAQQLQQLILKKSSYRRSIFVAPGVSKDLGHHRLTAKSALRFDHHQGFGDHLSYAMGGIYESPLQTQYKMSYGTGFKAPTLYQRFVNTSFARGNPFLKPEVSRGVQVEVEQPFSRNVNLQVMYFRNEVKQLIQSVQSPLGTSDYQNMGRATFQGFEEKLTWSFGKVKANFAHVYVHTHNHTTHKSVLRRPKNGFHAGLAYEDKEGLTAGFCWRYASKPYDVDPKTFLIVQGKVNTSLDLFANYAVNKHMEAFLKIDNALNRKNEMPLGYSRPGMTALTGVTVTL